MKRELSFLSRFFLSTQGRSFGSERSSGWSFLATVPQPKLVTLYLGFFFAFSVIGFYDDLIIGGAARPWIVLLLSALNGAISALYPYFLIFKKRIYLWLLMLVSLVAGPFFAAVLSVMSPRGKGTHPSALVFDADGVLVCLILSYLFSATFIRYQATQAFRIGNELELARGIQRTLVPNICEQHEGFEFVGISLPSEKVGGDLVDVVHLGAGSTVAYVADISGHGLQAGILMGMFKTAMRSVLLEPCEHPRVLLGTALDRLNRVLPTVKERNMYATLSALHLDPSGIVHFALAAHPAILHYHVSTKLVKELSFDQFPIGLLVVDAFEVRRIHMERGDILAIVTDGILESCNDQEEEFGLTRVIGVLISSAGDLQQQAHAILDAVRAFGKQSDDQSLLLIRRL